MLYHFLLSEFLFSCIPVCLLPPFSPKSTPPFQFPSPNPTPPSALKSSPSPHLWDHHHYHHSPKELYSVADIFPASRDKNKVCCFVWSHARAFVPVKKAFVSARAACFLSLSKHTCISETKRQGEGGLGSQMVMDQEQGTHRRRKCLVIIFLTSPHPPKTPMLTKPSCGLYLCVCLRVWVCVCICGARVHDRPTPPL